MPNAAHILLIEDDASLASNLTDVLQEDGFLVTVCNRGDEGLRLTGKVEFDVVLTDLRLPGLSGLELVRQLHQTQPRLPVVLMTAHGTIETAIEATKLGAYDYLQKPFEMRELLSVLHRAAEAGRLMREPVNLPDAPVASGTALVGQCRAMQDVCKELGRIAARPVTVLIRGETGTGKELIARAIYQHSLRANAPFIAINCAAVPENLLESELFGHERGAFTGAVAARQGAFELADGGTLFLDEIGELPLDVQPKLLRVLETKEFRRVGGNKTVKTNVRVIAATKRNLLREVQAGKFREDLYFRLAVVPITVPPLRARREDIPALVQHILKASASNLTVADETMQGLVAHDWPGNVRELRNVLERTVYLARAAGVTELNVVSLPAASASTGDVFQFDPAKSYRETRAKFDAEFERRYVKWLLGRHGGNVSAAAREAKMDRKHLHDMAKKHGLRGPEHDDD